MPTQNERQPRQASDQDLPGSPGMLVWTLGPVIAHADIPVLCEQLALLVCGSDVEVVICDVGAITEPDAVTIDALARLQLTIMRLGRHIRLDRANPKLRGLLALTGLADVLPLHGGVGTELCRQPEQREQPLGVEKRVEPHDPAG